eukprot:TRINITY_DN17618_c0_g1_i1.p1 TRINITY_DN17618_c0_g1~~TRINITY_DN17618_c0_g1_i1.p1  ORF type:complete len:279 (-),score=125.50 TRINITY_DN17618_c0_g1_i1:59-895(-)
MTTMNLLMGRLYEIQSETSDKPKEKGKTGKKEDPFTLKKKVVGERMRELREKIKARDQELEEHPNSEYGVILSSELRSLLSSTEAEVKKLDEVNGKDLKKYQKKRKKPDEKLDEQFDVRRQLVECAYANLDECKNLEKRRYGTDVFIPGVHEDFSDAPTSLPSVAGDQQFELLMQRDAELDSILGSIHQKVKTLDQMAMEMGNVIDTQTVLIEEVNDNVTEINEKLVTLNRRMRDTLHKLRSWDMFIVDFIIVCLLCGLAGIVYKVVRKRGKKMFGGK